MAPTFFFFCKFWKTYETPSLTYSYVFPHLASVSRRWLSPQNHFSYPAFFECLLVASLENAWLDFGSCLASYKNKWWLHLNKSGSDTLPLRKRSDFKQAVSTLERLNQEAGEEQLAPTPHWKNKQWKSASSSSSTWWQWQDSWWSS